MYSKCFSCRLYDSLLCGRSCEGYSLFDPICKRQYYYVDSSNNVKGPVEAYMLPYYGVTSMSYVWTKGMKDWIQAYHISELCFIPAPVIPKTNGKNSKENFLSVWSSIPLGTKILYTLYLLVLLFFVFCHLDLLISVILEKNVFSDITSLFFLIGIPFVVNGISIWGIWQLLRCQRKAGFWFSILSLCFHVIGLGAMVGGGLFDYQGTLANPTSYDIFRDYSYPVLGGFAGFVISYIFISVLWGSLYLKRKGLAFMSYLNNEKLLFPLSLLRLFPIILFLLFAIFWTIMSFFFN